MPTTRKPSKSSAPDWRELSAAMKSLAATLTATAAKIGKVGR